MFVMSINSGNNSLDFTLFEMSNENVVATGIFDRIGLDGSYYRIGW